MKNLLEIGDIIDTSCLVNSSMTGKRKLLYYNKRVPNGTGKEFVTNEVLLCDKCHTIVIVSMRYTVVPFMVSIGIGGRIKRGDW